MDIDSTPKVKVQFRKEGCTLTLVVDRKEALLGYLSTGIMLELTKYFSTNWTNFQNLSYFDVCCPLFPILFIITIITI